MSVCILLTDKAWEQIARSWRWSSPLRVARPCSVIGCASKRSSMWPAPAFPGVRCQRSLAAGRPPRTASAAGQVGGCGAHGGTTDHAECSRWLKPSAWTRRLGAPISRRPGRETNGGPAAQALGRSRGGRSTNIPAGSRDDTTGVSFVRTGGHRLEAPDFDAVCAQQPQAQAREQAIRDRGSDRQHSRHSLHAQGMTPVIPPQNNRQEAPALCCSTVHMTRESGALVQPLTAMSQYGYGR